MSISAHENARSSPVPTQRGRSQINARHFGAEKTKFRYLSYSGWSSVANLLSQSGYLTQPSRGWTSQLSFLAWGSTIGSSSSEVWGNRATPEEHWHGQCFYSKACLTPDKLISSDRSPHASRSRGNDETNSSTTSCTRRKVSKFVFARPSFPRISVFPARNQESEIAVRRAFEYPRGNHRQGAVSHRFDRKV